MSKHAAGASRVDSKLKLERTLHPTAVTVTNSSTKGIGIRIMVYYRASIRPFRERRRGDHQPDLPNMVKGPGGLSM